MFIRLKNWWATDNEVANIITARIAVLGFLISIIVASISGGFSAWNYHKGTLQYKENNRPYLGVDTKSYDFDKKGVNNTSFIVKIPIKNYGNRPAYYLANHNRNTATSEPLQPMSNYLMPGQTAELSWLENYGDLGPTGTTCDLIPSMLSEKIEIVYGSDPLHLENKIILVREMMDLPSTASLSDNLVASIFVVIGCSEDGKNKVFPWKVDSTQ